MNATDVLHPISLMWKIRRRLVSIPGPLFRDI